MKKTVFLLIFFVSTFLLSAQITIVGNHLLYQKEVDNKTVKVIVFDSITSSTEIKYDGSNVRFYKYADANTNNNPVYPTLNPDDATGYIVKVNDVAKDTIWVIDYVKYRPVLKSINDVPADLPCKELNLSIISDVPLLTYQFPGSTTNYTLPRKFKISYGTVEWNGTEWKPKPLTDSVYLTNNTNNTKLISPIPLDTTIFTISGDQYADSLNIVVTPAKCNYTATAVECRLKTNVSERTRDKNNEADAPSNKAANISFSVPIDVEFLSNPSPAVTYYNWTIYKDGQLIVNRTDKDHRYSFTDYGTYKVKLIVSSTTCSYSDSLAVNAYEAVIQVPNVFTPNGDDRHDEFRVAYKSLLGFECWVYNRWGRKIFYWSDPTKGWDGKINGKDAAEGAYFYVIKATGYGLDPKTKHDPKIKSTITLKGDINLLRGKVQ